MQIEQQHSRGIVIGSVLFIVAALTYVLTEAIAASAWHEPSYRYAFNYISDLGVTGPLMIDGREVLSPLAWVMNTGFAAHGIWFAVGYLLISPILEGKAKILTCLAAIVHGIGNLMIGYFPGVSYEGLSPHLIGAGMAIIGGNLAVLWAGVAIRRRFPRISLIGITLGIVGIVALGIMVSDIFGHPAVFERLSVYTMTAWDLILGFSVLLASRSWFRRRSA